MSSRPFLVPIVCSLVLLFPSGPVFPATFHSSGTARGAAMGGNLSALTGGPSGLSFNPAGLGGEDKVLFSARYEDLFSGFSSESLSSGNLSAVIPLGAGAVLGTGVDHFNADLLQQDRVQAALGLPLGRFQVGLSICFLRQAFVLTTPLPGVDPAGLSGEAFSIGAGLLYRAGEDWTFGVSGQDLTQPNLGVIGTDRLPILLRTAAAKKVGLGKDALTVTLGQSLEGDLWRLQGGIEWDMTEWGVALRAGADQDAGSLGFGWTDGSVRLDYAFRFSLDPGASLGGVGLPGSHLLELGLSLGTATAMTASAGTPDPRLRQILDRAASLLEKGDRTGASREVEKARSLFPGDPLVESMARFLKVPKTSPGKQDSLEVQRLTAEAEIYRGKGRMDLAREAWQKVLKVDPSNVRAKESLSGAAIGKGPGPTEAQKRTAQALYEKGLAFYLKENLKGAIRAWEEALRSDPGHVNALNNLIRARLESEKK